MTPYNGDREFLYNRINNIKKVVKSFNKKNKNVYNKYYIGPETNIFNKIGLFKDFSKSNKTIINI